MARTKFFGRHTAWHWFTVMVGVFALDFGLRHIRNGEGEHYLHEHLWLLLVPMAVIFLVVLVWQYYLQYKQ